MSLVVKGFNQKATIISDTLGEKAGLLLLIRKKSRFFFAIMQ